MRYAVSGVLALAGSLALAVPESPSTQTRVGAEVPAIGGVTKKCVVLPPARVVVPLPTE